MNQKTQNIAKHLIICRVLLFLDTITNVAIEEDEEEEANE